MNPVALLGTSLDARLVPRRDGLFQVFENLLQGGEYQWKILVRDAQFLTDI